MADLPEEAAPSAASLEETRGWIEQLKPAAVLGLLKDPEHSLNISRAFFGYRPDAKSYANTLVRSRLAQAAVKDSLFAKKLRELAELTAPLPAAPPQSSPAPVVALASLAESKPDKADTLRAERDQRRRERDEARQALSVAQSERDEAVKMRGKMEAERDEALRQSKKQTERIARLERQTLKQQEVEARLVRTLNQDKISPPPAAAARAAGLTPPEAEEKTSPWLTAVYHILDKSKFDQALALAGDVLKVDAENADALEISVRAWEGRRELTQALPYLRRLLAGQIARREIAGAADTLGRLLKMGGEPARAEAEARRFLASLLPEDHSEVEAGRRLLARLRGADPGAYAWLTAYIAAHTPLGPVLMPPPGALGADDPLPLRVKPGQAVTAHSLADAVDQGNEALVDSARLALAALEKSDAQTHGRVWLALEQASQDDLSRLLPLRRLPRGPIVVDGSNVAWFDQESLTYGKPRLRHLREMRRFLRGRGFFPVVLYADANLPYFIDEPALLRLMQNRRELLLVDAGTVADEVLLRMAKHLSAPLVTNDKMEDWDPDGEVLKVRYTISLGGEAHLLTDI